MGLTAYVADPSKTYTDEQYTKIAQNLLDKVQDRTASADNAGVRNAFAILMLLRASNGTPADLRDKLVNSLKDEKTQQLAQNEWLTPALAKPADYDPMLGAADAGQQPNIDILMPIPYVDAIAAMTGDIADECGLGDCAHSLAAQLSPQFDDPMGYGLSRTPRSTDPLSPANPRYRRGETSRNPTRPLPPGPIPPRPIPPEPDPYDGQSFN